MYGIYQRGYYVKCGRCGKQHAYMGGLVDQPTVPDHIIVRDMRNDGWGMSKKRGLVCPDCKGKKG